MASTSTCAKRVGTPESMQDNAAMVSDIKVNGTASRSAVRTTAARESCAEVTSFRIR